MLACTIPTVKRVRLPQSVVSGCRRPQSTRPPRPQPTTQPPSDKASTFKDPFPLPLSSSELTSPHPSGAPGSPTPAIERTNESVQTLRARLVYQSRKRGTLEADLLLSTFAAEHMPHMTEAELHEFDKLMDEPDWDIYYWAIQKREPPLRWIDSLVLAKLRMHAANEGRAVRRMPDLQSKE